MIKLIPKSKIQKKIDSLKLGGHIPKYQNAGILKRMYYWRSPDYSKTEDEQPRSFSDAYALARNNHDKDFWWTDKNGNKNVYNTEFKLVPSQEDINDYPPQEDYKSLRYKYLEALENPHLIGYDPDTAVWTRPKKEGYDSNLIGIGLDTRTNNLVADFLEKTGRTDNPWLTLDEMKLLLDLTLKYLEYVLDKNTKKLNLSNTKRAITIGLLYHGYGPDIWKPNPKTQRIHDIIFNNGSDLDLINAVTDFYKGNDRAKRHSKFWSSIGKYGIGGSLTKEDKDLLWKARERMGANDSEERYFNYWKFQKDDLEVGDYFNSYLNSPGFQRILDNLNKWWKSRHPYRKFYDNPTKNTKRWFEVAKEVNPYLYTFDGYTQSSFEQDIPISDTGLLRIIVVGRQGDDEFPYDFTIGHEYLHGKTPFNKFGMDAPFDLHSAQSEALKMNTNTERGHDSRECEKHADIWGLKYLFYKEGIYDSRSDKDITLELIKKLRKKYPKLRPFKLMTDKQIMFLMNNVAYNNIDLNNNTYYS